MSDLRAYALRDEYAGTVVQAIDGEDREVPVFSGGLVNGGDNFGDVDVAKLLEEGGGTIVVDPRDPVLAAALDEYPPLKDVPVPDGASPVNDLYSNRGVRWLRAEVKRRGIDGLSKATKDELVAALEEYDRAGNGGNDDQGGEA